MGMADAIWPRRPGERKRERMDDPRTNGTAAHGHDLIVIGASSGGVEALLALLPALPADLPASVCVVVHTAPEGPGRLPQILARHAALPVLHATDGLALERGKIYIAPPDRHLLVEDGVLRVARGPRENRHRPAVDPLFRSAAIAYGPRVVGVVLSGALSDGTAGLRAIKRLGGIAVVQDPDEALFPSMPTHALRHVAVDHRLALAQIAPLLTRLAIEPTMRGEYTVPPELELEHQYARAERVTPERNGALGVPTALTCPECHGPLWEIKDGDLIRYRCRTGHAFSGDSMLEAQAEALEEALWLAINTLEEQALTAERLAEEANERRHHHVAARFRERAGESRRRAAVIRRVISEDDTPLASDADPAPPTASIGTPSVAQG